MSASVLRSTRWELKFAAIQYCMVVATIRMTTGSAAGGQSVYLVICLLATQKSRYKNGFALQSTLLVNHACIDMGR